MCFYNVINLKVCEMIQASVGAELFVDSINQDTNNHIFHVSFFVFFTSLKLFANYQFC